MVPILIIKNQTKNKKIIIKNLKKKINPKNLNYQSLKLKMKASINGMKKLMSQIMNNKIIMKDLKLKKVGSN